MEQHCKCNYQPFNRGFLLNLISLFLFLLLLVFLPVILPELITDLVQFYFNGLFLRPYLQYTITRVRYDITISHVSFAQSMSLLVQWVGLHYHLLQFMGGVTVDAVLLQLSGIIIVSGWPMSKYRTATLSRMRIICLGSRSNDQRRTFPEV